MRTGLFLTAIACWGCGHDEPINGVPGTPGTPIPGNAGPAVEVASATLESGFARGSMRQSVDVAAFRISRHPVTIGEFRACVAAGACKAPPESACTDWPEKTIAERPNYTREDATDDTPVTCVGLQGVRNYCTWVGGTLPTLEQWLLAARGTGPRRYPWGDDPATCDRHPLGIRTAEKNCPSEASALDKVEQHSAGASPAGVQDLLLTSSELLDTSAEALFSTCRKPALQEAGEDRACAIYGISPGAIDAVSTLRSTATRPDVASRAYGFRCVWGGAS